MLPVLMWISGEHFVLHYVDPRAKSRHLARGPDTSGDSSLEDEDEDDDDEDESYVLVEDKSRYGTWLNGVLIGRDCSMRAQDGDVITIRAPTRHAPNAAATGKIELISLVLRILTKAERLKQERFLILPTHPINDKYDILNTLGEFVSFQHIYTLILDVFSHHFFFFFSFFIHLGAHTNTNAPNTEDSIVLFMKQLNEGQGDMLRSKWFRRRRR